MNDGYAKSMLGAVKKLPPSTTIFQPVIYEAAGEAKYRAVFAISCTSPRRAIGNGRAAMPYDLPTFLLVELLAIALFVLSLLFIFSRFPKRSKPSVPRIAPGTIPFTRTPYGPHSTASTFVNASTPAFAAEE